MTDLASLSQALLAAVPADGSSIGNQTLLSRLQGQFAELTDEQFRAARDELIAQGALLKGRGRGGSVSRASVTGISLADQALNNARERREPGVAEAPDSYLVQAATKAKPAKLQPAISLAAMEKTLWATADKLRANMDAAEYKHIVLGLIFLKYISDSFAGRRAELEAKFADENDDYYLGDDALEKGGELLAAELEDRDYYREVNVFWVPEVARWEAIRAAAKQVDIGKKIDDALAAIEAENPKLKNILDKRYARAQLPDGKLGELVDLISTIGFGDDATLEAIAQAMFKSWFVDFDPVHAKAEGRQPEGMDATTASLFPDSFEESELGLVPKGWQVAALTDAYEINPSRKLKRGDVAPYLDMASVGTQGHVVDGVIDRQMGSGTKFINGDTLLARITPCLENGKTAFVDFLEAGQVGWGSTEFLVLRPKTPLPPFHGYLLARHPAFRDYAIQSMSGTSGRQRVQNDVLGRYLVVVPTKELAGVFAGLVGIAQQKIAANQAAAQTLTQLRDTLLPRLISGQIRLSEAIERKDAV